MITKEKRKSISRQIRFGIVLVAMLMLSVPVSSKAAGIDFNVKVKELQTKFPHQKYWNHVGMDKDNSDGYTNKPCTKHKISGVSHVYGTNGCTCNHFTGGEGHLLATQCMGFANKLGYDVFGLTKWTMYSNPTATQIANIKAGDIVRIDGYHSVFVIGRTGNVIAVGEANYPNGCQISWGRTIDLTTVTVSYYEHAANYDTVLDTMIPYPLPSEDTNQPSAPDTPGENNPSTPGDTNEQQPTDNPGTTPDSPGGTDEDKKTDESKEPEVPSDFTGWKKTADGKHYQYFKAGKLQKKKWLTIKKKKYYVDKNGYRVTGLYKISGRSYYFNSKGVRQKNKWVKVKDDYYYIGSGGYALKSQWLYHNEVLVYVKSNGAIAKSELVKIGKKTYYFNSKEKRSKGFKKYKGKYYYSDSRGVIQKKKWLTVKGKKYYLQKDGSRAQSKLLKIGKYRYYFNSKGQLQKKKTITYKGKKYKADKNGRCKFVEYCENSSEY